MKRKQYSVEQIVAALKQAELGMPVAAGLRLGVTEALQMEEGSLVGLAFDAGKAWPGIYGGSMKFFMTSPAASYLERERHWIVKLADGDRPGPCAV